MKGGVYRMLTFLEGKHQSRVLAGAFLDAKDSPKTQSSYLSSLTNSLSTLANEKRCVMSFPEMISTLT